ncbi:MAG: HAD-IA family hydrolase [Bacteroidaceae bacterium]|nr:HAD-IA family hydrolase [Bacteroidaceae bacterium]
MFSFLTQYGFETNYLKAVLFDMDGVLFDSMRNHAEAWVQAVEKHGLQMTREMVYENEGRTGDGTINLLAEVQWRRKATPEECKAIYETKSRVFNSLPEALPMPGAAQLLRACKQAGLTVVLVTGSGQKSLLEKLEHAYPGIFTSEYMVTAFDVKYGKPHPEPYLMGLKKAGCSASEAIVVENAPLGIRAGRAAGIFTIGVNTGPLADAVLANAGANIVVGSMKELAECAAL